MRFFYVLVTILACSIFGISSVHAQQHTAVLSPQEKMWLTAHDNTLVVYPQQLFIPFSTEETSGTPRGLSVDYLNLIAEKLGITVRYIDARPLMQILDEIKDEKADVVPALAQTRSRSEYLIFTKPYISIPTVIVQRTDVRQKNVTLDTLAGKKVAVAQGHAVEEYIRDHYPRIVLVPVYSDELGLQKVVLGEVSAIVMDATSFATYASRQSVQSLTVSGTTDFRYDLAFATTKDKEVVRSILNKGLALVTPTEQTEIQQKWKPVPLVTRDSSNDFLQSKMLLHIVLGAFGTLLVLGTIVRVRHVRLHRKYDKALSVLDPLAEDLHELEHEKEILNQEIEDIKQLEDRIKQKLHRLK